MSKASSHFENLLKSWAKTELNITNLNTQHIGESCQEFKIIGKLLSYSVSRVRSKKNAEKYIAFSKFTQICNEIQENNKHFNQFNENFPERINDERRLEMIRRIILLITGSDIYNTLQENKELTQLDSSQTLKIAEILQIINEYCKNIDSFEKLMEKNNRIQKYFNEIVLPVLTEGNYQMLFQEINSNIETLLKEITYTLNHLLYNKSQLNLSQFLITAAGDNTEEATNSSIQNKFSILKSLLDSWISLYKFVDAY